MSETGTGALEAAIEAAMAAAEEHAVHERHDGWACACGATGRTAPVPGSEAHRHLEAAAIRAAAPLIERDALQRAADAMHSEADRQDERMLSYAAEWLRERAAGGGA
jgi:4-aminobutyrate aminotransferase-like enzyme